MNVLNLKIESFENVRVEKYSNINRLHLLNIDVINILRNKNFDTMVINIVSQGEEMDYYCNLLDDGCDFVTYINKSSYEHFGYIFDTNNSKKIWDILEVLVPFIGDIADNEAEKYRCE